MWGSHGGVVVVWRGVEVRGVWIHRPQRVALPGDAHALEVPAAWLCSWVLGGRCAGAVLQQWAGGVLPPADGTDEHPLVDVWVVMRGWGWGVGRVLWELGRSG